MVLPQNAKYKIQYLKMISEIVSLDIVLTLFHAGSDTTYSTGKKKIFAQFLLHTLRAIKNRVTQQKAGLYLKKPKNGGRFKIGE